MIPEKWCFVSLSEILTRVRNPILVNNDTSYQEIGIRSHGKGIFYKNPKTGQELGSKSVFWIEPECFIVNIVFAWEQAIAKTTIHEKGMIASHRFPMYKPKSNHLSLEYLLYFFKTSKGKYLLELASPGGAGRNKTLGQAEFLKLEILLPPISEQLKIVEILGVWDEAIDLLERLIGKKRSRKQGLMQQLLTGKKRFKEFEGSEWRTVKLIDISTINYGKSPKNIFSDNGEFPVYGTGGITGYTSTHIHNGESVIIGRKGTIDKVRYINGKFWAIDTTYYLECKEIANVKWVYYFLSSANLAELNEASGVPSLNRDTLYAIKFKIPSLPEQVKIAAVLSAADEEISTLEKQLAAYKQQKLGLMQQLLTGRIRI